MYIGEKYKVGVIYNKDNLTLVRITCKVSATDENIYKTLKSLAPLIDCAEPFYEVQTIFRHILDEAPPSETPVTGESVEDVKIVVPKGEFILSNMIFTDEEIYGANYDGKDRTYRIIWVDSEGTEHFVPLDGIDTFKAENPHGAYSYNSETKELSFSAFMPYDTEYILRRYTHE